VYDGCFIFGIMWLQKINSHIFDIFVFHINFLKQDILIANISSNIFFIWWHNHELQRNHLHNPFTFYVQWPAKKVSHHLNVIWILT
jgi:hypothetical protein